jgi:hypothetical protein
MTALNNFNEQIREFYQQAVDCARSKSGHMQCGISRPVDRLERVSWIIR